MIIGYTPYLLLQVYTKYDGILVHSDTWVGVRCQNRNKNILGESPLESYFSFFSQLFPQFVLPKTYVGSQIIKKVIWPFLFLVSPVFSFLTFVRNNRLSFYGRRCHLDSVTFFTLLCTTFWVYYSVSFDTFWILLSKSFFDVFYYRTYLNPVCFS